MKAGSKVVDGEEGEEPNGEGEEGLDGSSSEEDSQSDNENEVEVEGNVKEADIGKLDTKVKLSKILRKKIRSSDVDYARGEGHLVDEESSDDSSSTEEEDGAEDTAHGMLSILKVSGLRIEYTSITSYHFILTSFVNNCSLG